MMVDVSATSLSGFYASEKRIQVSANNIANANTDGYQAQSVVQTSDPQGGVSTRVVNNSNTTAAVQANPPQQPPETPQPQNNVDLATEVVNAQIATYSAQASLKVLATADKLNQYLLDIQA